MRWFFHSGLRRGTVLVLGAMLVISAACESSKPNPTLPPHQSKTERVGDEPGEYLIPVAEPGKSDLSGTIKHDGKPIAAGRIVLFCKSGVSFRTGIIQDGKYAVRGLPEGPSVVCVLLDPNGQLPFPEVPVPAGGAVRPGPPSSQPGPPGKSGPGSKGGQRPPMRPVPHPVVNGPKPFPQPFLDGLRQYSIPSGQTELYQALHAKYGKVHKANDLTTTLAEGVNSYNITLTR